MKSFLHCITQHHFCRSFGLLAAMFCMVLVASTKQTLAEQTSFTLTSGDRVAFIGDGLMEQEQYHGWIELELTQRCKDADVTFRNLGWSGDTPAGASRTGLSLVQAGHEPEGEGWRQLQKQIQQTRPTVAFLGYGMASALEANADQTISKEELDQFAADYSRLIGFLRQVDPECRLVCLSPIAPVGTASLTDEDIPRFQQSIQAVADTHDATFVDLSGVAKDASLRKDPVHLNDAGYRAVAKQIASFLLEKPETPNDSQLNDALRQAIIEKNRLWFHRSRPANMAYVFGFRKREQGQNAVEIPQYDPLIEQQEALIAKLKKNATPAAKVDSLSVASRLKSKYAEFTVQPTPEFVVADDLEVTLWAENPMLNKPIHMNFDASGRLWVVSSEAYPMIEVGQALPDKVIVLQDTNGDGKANQSSVFADGLLIPTGIAPGDGGVYVAQSTDLLFLKDTDGDGKADERTRVQSGFGTEDTHHNLHTLLFGPDGRLYMNQSVYTRTDMETPFSVVRLKGGGGFRMDTRTGKVDVTFRGLWNAWGHQFDSLGNSFLSDGAGFAGIAYAPYGAKFFPFPGAPRNLDLISPGNYPKFCSAEIVYGKHYPDDWQGSLITCDFRANRVTRFTIEDNESGFVTKQQADLIRTSESTFRPIDVKQGPDGALYIADWSNPIINHGEVDFRDPRRDRWHGRIWRVAFKNRPLRKPTDLAVQPINQVVQHFLSSDRYLADRARRVLIERADETAKELPVIWETASSTGPNAIATLRLSAALGKPQVEWLDALLKNTSGEIRAAAIRTLADWSDPSDPTACLTTEQAMPRFVTAISDTYPRARLQAVSGLTRLDGVESAKLALHALDQPVDRFIEHLLHRIVHQNDDALVNDLSDPSWAQPEHQVQMEFVLTSVRAEKASEFLSEYLNTVGLPADGSGPWFGLIAKAGGPNELSLLFKRAADGSLSNQAISEALTSLVTAKRLRKATPNWKKNGKPIAELETLLRSKRGNVLTAAIQLAGAWQVQAALPRLTKLAGDQNREQPLRLAAISAIKDCGGKSATRALEQLLASANTTPIATRLVASLAELDVNLAIKPLLASLSKELSEQDALSLWRPVIAAKDGEAILARSIAGVTFNQTVARAGVRAATENGRKAGPLVPLLTPMTGTTLSASQWTPERAREIRRLVSLKGDPARGEAVYQRESLQCITCHAIGGVGGKVGPDMTSLGASAPVDYIIESMYAPNAKIKENYHSVIVLTADGKIVSGIESGSTEDEMVLRDASNKLIRIPESEIDQVKPGKSLMPEGLLARIPQQDQLDLIRFLTQLGKPGDYDASRQTVARSIDVFPGTHRFEQRGNTALVAGKIVAGWKTLSTRVNGNLDRDALVNATKQPRQISLVNLYLRMPIEASIPTEATIQMDNVKQGKVWIDGKAVGDLGQSFKLSAGKHTLLIQIDARGLPESLAIRSDEVTFLAN